MPTEQRHAFLEARLDRIEHGLAKLLQVFFGGLDSAARQADGAQIRQALVRQAFRARQARAARRAGMSVDEFREAFGDLDRCPIAGEDSL